MAYIVRNTLEKPGADVLLEYHLGPQDDLHKMFSDPRMLEIKFYRSADRSYAETFIYYESEEAYNSWLADNQEAHSRGVADIIAYMESMDIDGKYFFPPEDDYDWLTSPNRDPRIPDETEITYVQIFE